MEPKCTERVEGRRLFVSDVDASSSSSSALGAWLEDLQVWAWPTSARRGRGRVVVWLDSRLLDVRSGGIAAMLRCGGLDRAGYLLFARPLLNQIQDLMLFHNSLRSLVIAGPVSRRITPFLQTRNAYGQGHPLTIE